MQLSYLRRASRAPLYYISAAVILILLYLSFGCSKDEPTAPVSFKPPGVYSGTYYILRDWQSPSNEDTSLAYVTFNFYSDLTFRMDVDSVAALSEFSPCSVNGTFVFRGDSLNFDYSNPNPNVEICDPSVGPQGSFEYMVVQSTLTFISRGTDYRKIEFGGK
jgi:hypothetical protein